MTLLDCACRSVHGMDATAAQSFGTLWNQLRALGVELVLTHLHPVQDRSMLRLLDAHGVTVDAFDSREDARRSSSSSRSYGQPVYCKRTAHLSAHMDLTPRKHEPAKTIGTALSPACHCAGSGIMRQRQRHFRSTCVLREETDMHSRPRL